MSNEVGLGYQWLIALLTSDSTLEALVTGGWWRGMAPVSTVPAYGILSLQSGTDVITMNAFRMMTTCVYQVKVVGPASMTATLLQASARFDTLLSISPLSGVTSGGLVLSSYRQSPILLDELVDGELWTNSGGLYHLDIEQSN